MKWRSSSFVFLLASACQGKPSEIPIDPSRRPPTADVAELEIRASGVDRFAVCPPPGELGQHWIPPLPPWSPPPRADAGAPEPIDQDFLSRADGRTPAELAVDATHRDFRSCFRRGLVHDPTQDGRVAIVLRVGPSGHVEKVEAYAACELSPDAIACMQASARRLRFPPPAAGHETITIPAVFTSRDGVRRTAPTFDDSYTAAAYVTLETARPALHACEERARRELRPVQATGTFTLSLRPDGSVAKAHVDPWTGEQALLECAAHALEALRFAAPSDRSASAAGAATVVARLNFNPRQGAR